MHRTRSTPSSSAHLTAERGAGGDDQCATLRRTLSETVGIRELRQNLSRYVARTAQGESFEVTDRGRPVGRLVPPSTGHAWLDALVAEGRVDPARRRSPTLPRPSRRGTGSVSEALEAEREERLP